MTPAVSPTRLQRSLETGRELTHRLLTNGLMLRAAYRTLGGGLPIPPAALIRQVQSSDDPALYAWGGAMSVFDMRTLLYRNGLSLDRFTSILDFGCGSGRVMRHLGGMRQRLSGTDLSAPAVEWCRRNLPFRVTRNELDPPLSSDGAAYDLIYAMSVFTHLDGPRQIRWMHEFARVLRDGGYALITTHGTRFLRQLGPERRRQFDAGELVVVSGTEAGSNACTAYHPETWVRANLAGEMNLVDYAPWGAAGLWGHDMYLFHNMNTDSPSGGRKEPGRP